MTLDTIFDGIYKLELGINLAVYVVLGIWVAYEIFTDTKKAFRK